MTDWKAIQTALLDQGFNPGPLDGIPGTLTISAVKRFQEARGLVVDGVPGPITQAALGLSYNAVVGSSGGSVIGDSPADMLILWNSAQITKNESEVAEDASTIVANKPRYQTVASAIGCPWWVVGLLHSLEASFNFDTFLANGDPLFNSSGAPIKTIDVPAGLGPFTTWESAAIASLQHEGWNASMAWDIGNALMHLQAYNGMGYEEMGKNSPYIWSYTNHYTEGKYLSDGQYSATAVSEEAGCAAIMLGLQQLGVSLT